MVYSCCVLLGNAINGVKGSTNPITLCSIPIPNLHMKKLRHTVVKSLPKVTG